MGNRHLVGERPLSHDVPARISKALGTTVRLWINLQGTVDAWDTEQARADWQPAAVYGALGLRSRLSGQLFSKARSPSR